jgi:hypothetical protein
LRALKMMNWRTGAKFIVYGAYVSVSIGYTKDYRGLHLSYMQ